MNVQGISRRAISHQQHIHAHQAQEFATQRVMAENSSLRVQRSLQVDSFQNTAPVAQPAAPSPAELQEAFAQAGFKQSHLARASQAELSGLMQRIQQAQQTPGNHKFTVKIGGKKYKVKLVVGADGQIQSMVAKRKRGFFSKLGGALKKVAGVALKIASFIPGPIGMAARAGQAVMGAINSIRNGDILGAITGAVSSFGGGVGNVAGRATQALSSVFGRGG